MLTFCYINSKQPACTRSRHVQLWTLVLLDLLLTRVIRRRKITMLKILLIIRLISVSTKSAAKTHASTITTNNKDNKNSKSNTIAHDKNTRVISCSSLLGYNYRFRRHHTIIIIMYSFMCYFSRSARPDITVNVT